LPIGKGFGRAQSVEELCDFRRAITAFSKLLIGSLSRKESFATYDSETRRWLLLKVESDERY
jgi:hypothetical protein